MEKIAVKNQSQFALIADNQQASVPVKQIERALTHPLYHLVVVVPV